VIVSLCNGYTLVDFNWKKGVKDYI
jgi:hypothetical protein